MINQATFPLLLALSPAFQADPSAALERRLRRSLLRRDPIVAGTLAEPYEPGSSESPLRLLLAAEGLEISVTTASARILRELDLLVELDRRHRPGVIPWTGPPGQPSPVPSASSRQRSITVRSSQRPGFWRSHRLLMRMAQLSSTMRRACSSVTP